MVIQVYIKSDSEKQVMGYMVIAIVEMQSLINTSSCLNEVMIFHSLG